MTTIGALWKRSGNKGDFLAGQIDRSLEGGIILTPKQSIMIFPVTDKKSEKAPDYRIVVAENKPKEGLGEKLDETFG